MPAGRPNNGTPDLSRHSVGVKPRGQNQHHDQLAVTLDVIARMCNRSRAALPSGLDTQPFALVGPGALGIISGNPHPALSRIDLMFTSGDYRTIAPLLDHRLAHLDRTQRAIASRLVKDATYCQFTPAGFARPATELPSQGDDPMAQLNRGYRILVHAALRSTSISRVRVTGVGTEALVDLPLPTPDGMTLIAIARLGREAGLVGAIERALSYEHGADMSPERREQGQAALVESKRRLQQFHDDLALMTPSMRMKSLRIVTAGYLQVTDRVIEDPDVRYLAQCATTAFNGFVKSPINGLLRDIDWRTSEFLAERAAETVHRDGPTPRR